MAHSALGQGKSEDNGAREGEDRPTTCCSRGVSSSGERQHSTRRKASFTFSATTARSERLNKDEKDKDSIDEKIERRRE